MVRNFILKDKKPLEDSKHKSGTILIYVFKGSICCGENGLQGAKRGTGTPVGKMLCYFSPLGFHTFNQFPLPRSLLILSFFYPHTHPNIHQILLIIQSFMTQLELGCHYSRFLYLQYLPRVFSI